jgi:2-C-methyl-D-erythritol 4-phosphate cytidylyltransferase
VVLVEGRASNIKITQPEDLLLAEFYLTQRQAK